MWVGQAVVQEGQQGFCSRIIGYYLLLCGCCCCGCCAAVCLRTGAAGARREMLLQKLLGLLRAAGEDAITARILEECKWV
jgi:hypothetical protein